MKIESGNGKIVMNYYMGNSMKSIEKIYENTQFIFKMKHENQSFDLNTLKEEY